MTDKPSHSIVVFLALTLLSLLPAIMLTCTSFTKILVVLGLARNALGLQQTPNNQVLAGLALFLSLFIMAPVLLAAGLPVEGLGILLGVDTIPDMFRTTTNVTGTMSAATILAERKRRDAAGVRTAAVRLPGVRGVVDDPRRRGARMAGRLGARGRGSESRSSVRIQGPNCASRARA